jgi:hypothetical protein
MGLLEFVQGYKAITVMNTTYQITTDQDDIIIRFPRRLVDEVELARLLDYYER